MTDHVALRQALADYVRTTVGSYGIADTLYQLTDRCVEVLGCDGAGVSVGDVEGRLRFVTATDAQITPVEEQQVQGQDGPCYEAFTTGKPVVIEDLTEQRHRWPNYCQVAIEHGCHAVMGIPMGVDDTPIGALNVYRYDPHTWDDEELEAAGLLADMASGYITNLRNLSSSQRLATQLQQALDTRTVIEQAKGVLAARHDLDMDAAFTLLRGHARRHQRRLHDVARDVAEGRLDP